MTEAKQPNTIEQAEPRFCLFCGESLEGKRKDAKFCKPAHRVKWNRRQKGVAPQWRQINTVRTDTIEFYIALVRHRETSAETVLRQLADRVGAPIRESAIDEEHEKLEEGAKRRRKLLGKTA